MRIIIDNGHGCNTPGKCSPDRRLLEYSWCREIARSLVDRLSGDGIDARLLVPELTDVPLMTRVQRVNRECSLYGRDKVLVISIHVNASGADGKWHEASGWSVFVARKAGAASRRLAATLYDEAAGRGLQGNRYVPPERYWQADFTMLSRTQCAAVLTENMFQDNRADCDYLLSDAGRNTIVDLHHRAIMRFLDDIKPTTS